MDMLTIGKMMTIIGILLIIGEMLTGASALFLAVIGLIFMIGGLGIELSGMTDYGLILTLIASIGACVFFFIFVWGKKQSKDGNMSVDRNGYEGQTFIAKQELTSGSTVNGMDVFGISFEVTNQGEIDIAVGDEVVVVKESVRRLYVKRV